MLLDESAFTQSRGSARKLTFLERGPDGQEVRQGLVELPEDGTPQRVEYRLAVKAVRDGLVLLEAWSSPREDAGNIFRVAADYSGVEQLGGFPIDLGYLRTSSLAVSGEGRFLTTGQAVFGARGDQVMTVNPPLSTCVWSDGTLHGVRRYPFVGFEALNRWYSFNKYVSSADVPVPDRNRDEGEPWDRVRQAAKRSRWVLRGLDEAGREDEAIEVGLP